eukprot:g56557.t1
MDANKPSDTFPVPEPAPKGHIDPSAEEFEMFELLQRRLPAVIVLVDQLQIHSHPNIGQSFCSIESSAPSTNSRPESGGVTPQAQTPTSHLSTNSENRSILSDPSSREPQQPDVEWVLPNFDSTIAKSSRDVSSASQPGIEASFITTSEQTAKWSTTKIDHWMEAIGRNETRIGSARLEVTDELKMMPAPSTPPPPAPSLLPLSFAQDTQEAFPKSSPYLEIGSTVHLFDSPTKEKTSSKSKSPERKTQGTPDTPRLHNNFADGYYQSLGLKVISQARDTAKEKSGISKARGSPGPIVRRSRNPSPSGRHAIKGPARSPKSRSPRSRSSPSDHSRSHTPPSTPPPLVGSEADPGADMEEIDHA